MGMFSVLQILKTYILIRFKVHKQCIDSLEINKHVHDTMKAH